MSLVQRLKLLRHTSGRCLETAASLDRYATIRNFFKQYRTVHTSPPLTASLKVNHSTRHYRSSLFVGFNQTLFTVRCFSRSTRVYDENKQRTSPQPELNGEQGRGEKRNASEEHGENHSSEGREPRGLQNLDNYPPFFRRLALSLPHLHRPTKDDFLKVANGFWQRARVRFRWITIRSFRKYNADDISAFITWFFMSQTLWLLVGT